MHMFTLLSDCYAIISISKKEITSEQMYSNDNYTLVGSTC